MIAWMNNWQYANHIPTSPWRSPMSLVREIFLHTTDKNLRLVQQPVGDWAAASETAKSFSLTETTISDGARVLEGAAGSVQCIDVSFTPGSAEEFGLIVRGGDETQGTRIGIRPADRRIVVDRRESGQTDFHGSFASLDTAPIRTTGGSYRLTIYVDQCSVEVFAQGGQFTLTELIFPAASSTDVSLYASGGTATINNLRITQYV
jgi:fructan beta-fructosidase